MSGGICSLSLASQELGKDRLYNYVVLLGYFKDSLVCEIITDLLHYSLEFVAVSCNENLSGCGTWVSALKSSWDCISSDQTWTRVGFSLSRHHQYNSLPLYLLPTHYHYQIFLLIYPRYDINTKVRYKTKGDSIPKRKHYSILCSTV